MTVGLLYGCSADPAVADAGSGATDTATEVTTTAAPSVDHSSTGPTGGSDSDSASPSASSQGDADTTGADSGSADGPDASSGGSPGCTADVWFEDDFESGEFDHTQDGIAWTDTAWVGVESVIARSGGNAVRFRYQPSPVTDDGVNAELRFNLGEDRPEVYARYYVYLPDGSEPDHNAYNVRSKREGGTNNKFFRLWHEEYSGPLKWGASVGASDDGLARLFPETRAWGCNIGVGQLIDGSSWTLPQDIRGRWILVEWRVHGDDGTGNGLLQIWFDSELVIDEQEIAVDGAPCGTNTFLNGYLMGWANSGFDEETFVYIDDVAFSDSRIGPACDE